MSDQIQDRERHDSRRDDSPVEPDPTRLSRFLALILRHRAYQFDLRLDDEGFADFEELLDVMADQRNLAWVKREDVEKLVAEQDRKRYELVDGRIRATYGHSFRKAIRYPAITPPDLLYIGLPPAQAADARTAGLQPKDRQYVHLSADPEAALQLAQHHDPKATLVTVKAKEASAGGIQFHEPAEGLFLAARVPGSFIQFEVRYGRSGKKGGGRR